jgi:hypothetical protein
MMLTEAMMARGFAAADQPDQGVWTRLVLGGGVLLSTGGWLMQVAAWQPGWGLAIMLAGCAVVFIAFWQLGRRVTRSTYRQSRWAIGDTLIVSAAWAALAILWIPFPGIQRAALDFYPYPRLTLPEFDPNLAVGLGGLLMPGIILVVQRLQQKQP